MRLHSCSDNGVGRCLCLDHWREGNRWMSSKDKDMEQSFLSLVNFECSGNTWPCFSNSHSSAFQSSMKCSNWISYIWPPKNKTKLIPPLLIYLFVLPSWFAVPLRLHSLLASCAGNVFLHGFLVLLRAKRKSRLQSAAATAAPAPESVGFSWWEDKNRNASSSARCTVSGKKHLFQKGYIYRHHSKTENSPSD